MKEFINESGNHNNLNILIISRSPWRKDNSFGNTYSNIFDKMEDVKIANIFLADGVPSQNNKNIVSYYKVSEKALINSLFKERRSHFMIGERLSELDLIDTSKSNIYYNRTVEGLKKIRWSIFFIIRELIWKFGQVNYSGIMEFVNEFKPDIFFVPLYYAVYVSRIALYIKKKYPTTPIVLEASIDVYSLKQLSLDPFFWINRIVIRQTIKEIVLKSDKLYVISEKMKNDYQRMLSIATGVLYKFPDPNRCRNPYSHKMQKLMVLYSGNLGSGRWKTLGLLGNAISNAEVGKLVIYTPTPLTYRMKKALRKCDLCPPVSADQLVVIQNEADILVHVESFSLKNKLEVRYSISTKIMDYISVQRCILAVGPNDIASIEFLNDNKLALIATKRNDIESIVLRIKNNPEIISIYANKNTDYIAKQQFEKSTPKDLFSDLYQLASSRFQPIP